MSPALIYRNQRAPLTLHKQPLTRDMDKKVQKAAFQQVMPQFPCKGANDRSIKYEMGEKEKSKKTTKMKQR